MKSFLYGLLDDRFVRYNIINESNITSKTLSDPMRLRKNFSLANLFDEIIVVSGGAEMKAPGETRTNSASN